MSKLHDILQKWTPHTMIPIPADESLVPIYPDYAGLSECTIQVGDKFGMLTCLGYSHDFKAPYVFKCECGRVFKSNCSLAHQVRASCGCVEQATRTAYLIRLRLETLRAWCSYASLWVEDLLVLKEEVQKYMEYLPKGSYLTCPKTQINRTQEKDKPLDIHVTVPKRSYADEYQQFLDLIVPTDEYALWLRNMAKKFKEDYPAWSAAPMSSLQGYEIMSKELPEFDAATYINFINYLVANPYKSNGSKEKR